MAITEKEKQRHYKSLDKTAEFADGALAYQRQHQIKDYEEAARQYRAELNYKGSSLPYVATFGADPEEDETETKFFSKQECDSILSDMVKARMKREGENYEEAHKVIFEEPTNQALVEAYNA